VNGLAFAFELKLATGSIGKFRLDMSVSLLSHEDLSRRRGPLQTRGDIDGISQHRVIRDCACAHVADVDGNGYFGMFSVDPAQQGGGVGKQLMDAAEAHAAREWKVPVMQMTVIDVRDELIAFYERRGYQRTGIKKPFPYGDERFGIPKRDDLRFEVLEKPLAGAAA